MKCLETFLEDSLAVNLVEWTLAVSLANINLFYEHIHAKIDHKYNNKAFY